jgi:hypothetical protein
MLLLICRLRELWVKMGLQAAFTIREEGNSGDADMREPCL